MSWQAISGNPFFTVALPLILTLVWSSWQQGQRFDDLNKRFDDLHKRFDDLRAYVGDVKADLKADIAMVAHQIGGVAAKVDNHSERIAKVEERTEGPGIVGKIAG